MPVVPTSPATSATSDPCEGPTQSGDGFSRRRAVRPHHPGVRLIPLVASLCLAGCAPTNDRFWPSIQPRPDDQAMGSRPQEWRPFF
jgi:hypothetical protein